MNKLLHRQLQKHFGKEEQVPENFTRLLNVISDSYDHYEKDRKLIERSIELSSKEMIDLNIQVKKSGKAELEQVHDQLKMLFENIEEVFYSVDVVKLKIVQMSAACQKVYGYSPEEFLDDRDLFYKIILPEDLHLVDQHFRGLYDGKLAISQYRILHKDKRVRWLESKVIPILDEEGQLIRLEGVTNDITERKRSEADILKAYEDKNTVLERIDDGFFAVDKNSTITYWNKKAEILLAAKKEDVIGKNLHEVFAATASNVFYNHYQKAISENQTVHFEEFSKRTNKWFAVGAFASDNGLSVYFKDVTERRESENKIKESELRYRSLIEQATDAICIADASLQFIDMNPYACEVLGYTKEEALQLFVPDILFPQDIATNPINKFDTIKINEIVRNERRFKRKDGSSVIMEISTRLMEDGRFIMFGHDVSERKRAESLLKENEGQLSVAAQIAKLGYWEFDVTLNLFKFNDQFYSMFRTTAEKVGGYTMSSQCYVDLFVYPDDTPIVAAAAAEAIKSPDPHYSHQIEHRIKYANGEIGYMAVRFFIVKNEMGRTIKTFGAIQDITESKKRETALLRSEASLDLINKELELKNKELEHFAFVASHDLQEPLRTTSSFVNLLQQQYNGKLDEKADKYLHFIAESTDRMKVLIMDLLEYSRIGNKKELQQVDCNTVLNELLQDLGKTLEETGAEIKVDTLPVISGYQTEIKQLFQNLVVNAIKFRKKDTTPQVSISAQKDSGCWKFAIRDNGIGMPEEHTDRIFVIFQRLHTRTEYEGSGIGLAHCKKIVGLHGGNIWVESKPGEGATFYFTIPLNQ